MVVRMDTFIEGGMELAISRYFVVRVEAFFASVHAACLHSIVTPQHEKHYLYKSKY